MCGFSGVVAPRTLSAAEIWQLERATTLLRHRGPDDEGFALIGANGAAQDFRGDDSIPECAGLPHITDAVPRTETIALGARRLSIIDLTASGHMPMTDGEGHWLVFNGEIYNYCELRRQLIQLGHRFHSGSDTEVLLRAYVQWGTACLEHFNGMWAFALWDGRQKKLFCSRDRFGEKQLYFHLTSEGVLWFASEIAPLRLAANGSIRVNQSLVWDFLLYGLADHTAETFFSGIQQLLPGTFLMFSPNCAPQVTRYYDLKSRPVGVPRNLSEASHQLREYLQDSVRLRLRSDVPVASFFSGGLDSSSIVALADRILPSLNGNSPYKVLRTYTHAYAEGHPYDESPRLHAALGRLASVDARFIPASQENFKRDLLSLVECQEQPFHNVSIFAAYNLLRLIHERDGIKVVLSGEAGDELLAGYQRVYLPLHLSRLLTSFRWRTWLGEVSAWNWPTALKASAKGFFRKLPWWLRAPLQRFRNPVVSLLRPEFLHAHAERDRQIAQEWRSLDLNARLVADLVQFNLPQLLRHLDRNAMQWSIETRVPFLDHRLVEFACSLPEEWKLRNGYSKFVLRRAMARDLPDEIVWERSKLGFGMAEQFWLKECLEILRLTTQLDEFIDVGALQHKIRSLAPGTGQAYWLPLSLGLWLQTAFPESH